MDFLEIDENKLRVVLQETNRKSLLKILNFIANDLKNSSIKNLPQLVKENRGARNRANKNSLIQLFMELFKIKEFREIFYKKLSKSENSSRLYDYLIWKSRFICANKAENLGIDIKTILLNYEDNLFSKDSEYSIIEIKKTWQFCDNELSLSLERDTQELLKYFYALPDNYNLNPLKKIEKCDYSYSNEENILNITSVLIEFSKNKLLKFGKNGEKPLVKSIKLLKESIEIKEFYRDTKRNQIVADMLIRVFYYYTKANKNLKDSALENLKNLTQQQLKDKLPFFITRVLAYYLKGIRYTDYYSSQKELFKIVKKILQDMPKDNSWVSMNNILIYSLYRDLEFHIEPYYKTMNYKTNFTEEYLFYIDYIRVEEDYYEIFYIPILKGIFFFLSALGILEIRYNNPQKDTYLSSEDELYLSHWDGLKYIKLTQLGKYILGFSNSYTPAKGTQKTNTIKLDKLKPIIRVDENDTLSKAKIEPFTIKLSDGKYELNHIKIFRNCSNYKELEAKIDSFFTNISKNPPKPFIDYFQNLKQNANLLKKETKLITLTLKPSKELLNFLKENKKIQELFYKAQGYKIVISKDNLTKFTKILNDNGFFIRI